MEMEQEADQPKFEIYPNRCLENGKKMYLNEHTADVRFLFGEKDNVTSISAHKVILATDSDVFERMFYGEMKEPGDIHVPDSTEVAFKEFLQYFYLDEVKLTAENLLGVLYLGAKYNVEKCVKNCVQSLVRSLDDENVCDQLNLAILYDQKEWIKVCEKRIMERADLILDSVEFLKCDKKVLAHILKTNVLPCNEIDVFKARMSWVKAKCGFSTHLSMELVERHLGKSFYDIRLASLTMDQLCTLHTQYESVLARDFAHITNIIMQPEFPEPKFNRNPRHAKWDSKAIVTFQRQLDDAKERQKHREYHDECRYDYDSESSNYSNHSDKWDRYDRELSSNCPCGFYNFGFDDDDGEEYLRRLDTTDDTIFSVSDPLFLGKLSCISVYAWQDCTCDVKTEMEVIEARELDGINCNTMLKMKINMKLNDATDISLPYPVLIRPGFFYIIRFGPFPQYTDYHCRDLKKEVKPESNVELKIHKNFKHSLVEVLNFNKI